MYIDIVPNRNSRPAILLRESVREGKRIVKRTIANLSALSREQAEAIRAVLKGESLAPVDALFEIVRARTMRSRRLAWRCSDCIWVPCWMPSPRASATWCWR